MKKLFLLLCLSTFLVACNQKTEQSKDNNPMSGYIKGDDIYTQGVHKFMKAYTDNNFKNAEGDFCRKCNFCSK